MSDDTHCRARLNTSLQLIKFPLHQRADALTPSNSVTAWMQVIDYHAILDLSRHASKWLAEDDSR